MTRLCTLHVGPSFTDRKLSKTHRSPLAPCTHNRLVTVGQARKDSANVAQVQLERHSPALSHFLSTEPRVILGSSSFGRQAMLQELGVPFEVLDPDIDEKAIRKESPEDLVMALAHAKADALLERLGPVDEPLYLVTADQVVVYNDTIREKPTSEAEAREFISGYSKAPAKRVGAIVVNHLGTGKTYQSLDIAEVRFQPIPENVIDILIKEGTVYKIAGGLMVEHELVLPLVSEVYGTMDSIIGLGKHVVAKLLLEAASDMQEMQES